MTSREHETSREPAHSSESALVDGLETLSDEPPAVRRPGTVARIAYRFEEFGVVVAMVVIVGTIVAFHPEYWSLTSLINVGSQAAFYGIMALGMVFLLAMREIDLSVGAIYGVSVISAALLIRDGLDPWLGMLIGIGVGAGLGAVNGLFANGLGLPTIIVTLGTLSMFRGLTLILSNSSTVSDLPSSHAFFTFFGGTFLRLPAAVWALLILTAVLTVVFKATRFGYTVRAIGSNEHAAQLSGIPIKRVRLQVMVLMGTLCGISGMLTLAFFAGADPSLGAGNELLVIAAAIIGGTGLAGGTGTVVGALLGALLISVIQSGLVRFGVTANWSSFVTGAVIIAAVGLDALVRRERARALDT